MIKGIRLKYPEQVKSPENLVRYAKNLNKCHNLQIHVAVKAFHYFNRGEFKISILGLEIKR